VVKVKDIALSTLGTFAFVGLFLGPISWYMGATFHGRLHALEASGSRTKATVDAKEDSSGYRYVSVTVDVHYTDKESGERVSANEIDLNLKYFNALRTGQSVDIYYQGSDVVLLDNYKPEYVPIIKRKHWGMIYTLFSYGLLLGLIVHARRKKRAQ